MTALLKDFSQTQLLARNSSAVSLMKGIAPLLGSILTVLQEQTYGVKILWHIALPVNTQRFGTLTLRRRHHLEND